MAVVTGLQGFLGRKKEEAQPDEEATESIPDDPFSLLIWGGLIAIALVALLMVYLGWSLSNTGVIQLENSLITINGFLLAFNGLIFTAMLSEVRARQDLDVQTRRALSRELRRSLLRSFIFFALSIIFSVTFLHIALVYPSGASLSADVLMLPLGMMALGLGFLLAAMFLVSSADVDLSSHYDQLKPVFQTWKDAHAQQLTDVDFKDREHQLVTAFAFLYLDVDLFAHRDMNERRAMAHIQASKYEVIKSLLDKIFAFEDDHNSGVSRLIRDIQNDVGAIPAKFAPALKEREGNQGENWFYAGQIASAIQQQRKPTFGGAIEVVYDGVAVIASIRNPDLRKAFLEEVEKLVEKFSERIQILLDDRMSLEAILDEMRGHVSEVIDGISTYHKLYGRCDFEDK